MTVTRWWGLVSCVVAASLLAAGPRMLLELGRFQNRWEGRPADPVVCSFRVRTGAPCLGCGGTHALDSMARGRVVQALQQNPLGAWVGLVLWTVAFVAGSCVLTGRRPAWRPLIVTLVTSGATVFLVTLIWWWHRLPANLALS
jgi:Protein of unknown function (DUF2752)